ncbi:MAG: ATP-dependent Clp protease proteolytic subunit [Candidatus Heimdallarchaeaceae archaeon]
MFRSLLILILSLVASISFAKTVTLSANNTVSIIDSINIMSVAKAQQKLMTLCSKSKADKYLVLYTPGGSVSAGRQFIDGIRALPCKVHTITIFAASMGYQIVQNLGTRYILSSGTLMSHRAFLSGLSGQLPGEIQTRIKYYSDYIEQLDFNTAKRLGVTLKDYKRDIYNELWLSGTKAVAAKHADEMVNVVCDDSLIGTKINTVNTFFGPVKLKVSKCPIIIGPLGIEGGRAEVKAIMEFFNSHTSNFEWK